MALPVERPGARHVYHLFTARHPRRDAFVTALAELGVGTAVHYPIPIPAQPMFDDAQREGAAERWPEAWRAAQEVVSLPCFPELRDEEQDTVAAAIRQACARV